LRLGLRLGLVALAQAPIAALAIVSLQLPPLLFASPEAERRGSGASLALGAATGELTPVGVDRRGCLWPDGLRGAFETAAAVAATFAGVCTGLRLHRTGLRGSGLSGSGRLLAPAALAALDLGPGLRLRRLRLRARLLDPRLSIVLVLAMLPMARLRHGRGGHQGQSQRHKGDAFHSITPIRPIIGLCLTMAGRA
jgi:hypothetical protein